MRYLLRAAAMAVAVPVALWFVLAAGQGKDLDLGDQAGLQAAMQQYIDGQSVDGAYLALDAEHGAIRKLYPDTAHPMILTMGEQYVLCYDFLDDQGTSVDVDFYLARRGESFIVFHAAIGNRDLLKRLMAEGKVSRAG